MIIRTYECLDCKEIFEVTSDRSDEPPPGCPYCQAEMEWKPKSFAITGVKSKAIDYAQDVLEKDFGLTNFKDNNREGDVGVIMPSETTAAREAREAMERDAMQISDAAKVAQQNPAVRGFWAGGHGGAVSSSIVQNAMDAAKRGPKGVDPIKALHDQGRAGNLPFNIRVVGKS